MAFPETLSANGNTGSEELRGPVLLSGSGAFGGGTLVLEVADANGNFVPVSGVSLTASGAVFADLPPNTRRKFRANLSGATSPSVVVDIQD